MKKKYNNLPWHDAIIQFIYIDRNRPGEQDIIKILINWTLGNDSSVIEFYDCYASSMNLNFGILASESILTAECFDESEELDSIRQKWSKVGVDLRKLLCFQIITNSTNSIINIYALGFRLDTPKGSIDKVKINDCQI